MSCQHTQSHIPATPGWRIVWPAYDPAGEGQESPTDVAVERVIAWHVHTRIAIEDNGEFTNETITHPISAFLVTNKSEPNYLLAYVDDSDDVTGWTLYEPDGSIVEADYERGWRKTASDWFLNQHYERLERAEEGTRSTPIHWDVARLRLVV